MKRREIVQKQQTPPLVLHFIWRLGVGGLENNVVNLINHMSADRYRHAILCLTEFTDFRRNIHRAGVPVMALHKRRGRELGVYFRLQRAVRQLRPDIVHTRNLATVEGHVCAALAGVPGRIHSEEGRDAYDLEGTKLRYILLRKTLRPLIHHYTAASKELAEWLIRTVGVRPDQVTQVRSGVDVHRFRPRSGERPRLGPEGFAPQDAVVIGSLGRMSEVKDQLTLVRAFLHILETRRDARSSLRLALIGEGPLHERALRLVHEAKAEEICWIPGKVADTRPLLQAMDVFVLPSLAEGIPNTVLEAMASGLPVVATCVGGVPEVVLHGETGALVPASDPVALAQAIETYVDNAELRARHGQAARARVEVEFSLSAMVEGYLTAYDRLRRRTHP